MKPRAISFAGIKRRGTRWCAATRSKRSTSIAMPSSNVPQDAAPGAAGKGTPGGLRYDTELANQIGRYLEELKRGGASAHSVRAYAGDLRQFLDYLSPPDLEPPEPQAIDVLIIREWLAGLYRDQLT